MEASDRARSSDSIDVISLKSESNIKAISSRASFLMRNSQSKNDSNIQDIEALNRMVKINQYHSLRTNRSDRAPANFPTDDADDTAADRLASTLKHYFYKYILFKCFKVQLPSDD